MWFGVLFGHYAQRRRESILHANGELLCTTVPGVFLKISVVTAVRNGASAIRPTLDSVAAQSYRDVEHVVVDGASTDGTADVVRAHGGRVAQLVSERDAGVYDAFNKGWRLATGDVVGYLNAADVYTSADVLGRIAEAFSPDVDAVFGDVLIVDGETASRPLRVYRSNRFRPDRLAYGLMPAHPTLFLRRGLYERLGGYDASYRIAGDYELCVRLFVGQRIRYRYIVGPPMVRMPRGGLSNSGWRSTWTITREMQRACAANGVPTNLLKLCSRLPRKMLELVSADE
jgi:glycosyltransferase involved in cell wall biosynthesis